MSAEQWKKVENKPGGGSFHVKVIADKVESQYDVPAIDLGFAQKFEKQYVNSQLEKGVPVVAYRTGDRGMCVVLVNSALLHNPSLTRHYYDRQMERMKYVNENPLERSFIGGYQEGINIKATTRAGLPFSATISFIPSPK